MPRARSAWLDSARQSHALRCGIATTTREAVLVEAFGVRASHAPQLQEALARDIDARLALGAAECIGGRGISHVLIARSLRPGLAGVSLPRKVVKVALLLSA